MFEQFTNRARRVIVLAQEEARGLQHNYIGTEHILLGLLRESDGLAAQALSTRAVSLDSARRDVISRVGRGDKHPEGRIPFTPRAKKSLEHALREAVGLQHNYIGTEHILLGLLSVPDGVAGEILAAAAGDLSNVRTAILDLMPPGTMREPNLRRLATGAGGPGTTGAQDLRITPAADTSITEAARLAGTHPIGSHHLLLAALNDPVSAATRALSALDIDLDQIRGALQRVDVADTSDEAPEDTGRRHMRLRATEDELTLEITDKTLIDLARKAQQGLAVDVIGGDLPEATSLGTVWRTLHDSLVDICRRATTTPPSGANQSDQTAERGSG
jgi:ATP-dependent Clp protease ATP-binding subunit ClpA